MTELERRALLGDKTAQEECTDKGIVLPCSFCKSKWTQVRHMGWENTSSAFRVGYRGECTDCHAVSEAYTTREEALSHWNTLPAPPVGRCGECIKKPLCINYRNSQDDAGFCKWFETKDREERGKSYVSSDGKGINR